MFDTICFKIKQEEDAWKTMPKQFSIKFDMFQLLVGLSEIIDLVSSEMVNHHKYVAFIAYGIGKTKGLPQDQLRELTMAGALHDIGGLSLQERQAAMAFDLTLENAEAHTIPGYLLLSTFNPFKEIARLVRFHHVHWQDGAGKQSRGEPVPQNAHILHLADQISVLMKPEEEILAQIPEIINRIDEKSGTMFVPEDVEAFMEIASKYSFWLDLTSPTVCTLLAKELPFEIIDMNESEFMELAQLFRRVIDFRSRFTVTHSSGVAVVAEKMARRAGFDSQKCLEMKIAGHLHDIGKLSVPSEILEKKTALTHQDFTFLRKHPYFSYRILQSIDGFERISEWSGMHHERLDGRGYPFCLKKDQLSFGARIMAVADTFTAITEVRPYRTSLSSRRTLNILQGLAENGKIDADAFDLIKGDIDEINDLRAEAQQASYRESKEFMAAIGQDPESIPSPCLD